MLIFLFLKLKSFRTNINNFCNNNLNQILMDQILIPQQVKMANIGQLMILIRYNTIKVKHGTQLQLVARHWHIGFQLINLDFHGQCQLQTRFGRDIRIFGLNEVVDLNVLQILELDKMDQGIS